MSDVHEKRLVADINELVGLVEIRDVVYYELAARRRDAPSVGDEAGAEPDAADEASTLQEGDLSPIAVMERHGEDAIEVRCRLQMQDAEGVYVVDAAVFYSLEEHVEIADDTVRQFVERVGIMACYPYLREGLHGLASKLRLSVPVLGLVKAGSVSVTKQ